MSNDWIEHNGGTQPVEDGVFVEVCATVDYTVNLDDGLQLSQFAPWARKFKYRILNQHLIDAARLEGIRLGLEAAAAEVWRGALGGLSLEEGTNVIRNLSPDTIAKEAQHD